MSVPWLSCAIQQVLGKEYALFEHPKLTWTAVNSGFSPRNLPNGNRCCKIQNSQVLQASPVKTFSLDPRTRSPFQHGNCFSRFPSQSCTELLQSSVFKQCYWGFVSTFGRFLPGMILSRLTNDLVSPSSPSFRRGVTLNARNLPTSLEVSSRSLSPIEPGINVPGPLGVCKNDG